MPDAASEAPRAGAFSAAGDRWAFDGALILADAADVYTASKSLPLPAGGVVDFSGLTKADSAAIAVMIALKRRAAAEGRALTISALPASLRSLAIVYGVEDLLAD
jgi:phospholipid transport system transporter-binding protein